MRSAVDPADAQAAVDAVAAAGLDRSRWAPPAAPLDDLVSWMVGIQFVQTGPSGIVGRAALN